MTTPEVAVGGVVVDGGRLLLVRRDRPPDAGAWSVPGGRVHRGETLHEAVVREVEEETGLEVVVDHFLGWVERIASPESDEPYHFVILDFAATPVGADRRIHAASDARDVAWVDLADLGEWRLVDGLAEFLEDVGILPRTRQIDF